MKLRYTGTSPVTFMDSRVGERQPGEEFTLPDEVAVSFLTRQDVEEVKDDVETSDDDHAEPEPDPEPEPAVTSEVEAEPVAEQDTTDNS